MATADRSTSRTGNDETSVFSYAASSSHSHPPRQQHTPPAEVASRVGFGLLPEKKSVSSAPRPGASPLTNSAGILATADVFQILQQQRQFDDADGKHSGSPSLASWIESRHAFFQQQLHSFSINSEGEGGDAASVAAVSVATATTAMLSEKLADTHETYQAQMATLRQERTIWRADRKELERLRQQVAFFMKQQQQQTQNGGSSSSLSMQQQQQMEFTTLQETYRQLVQEHAQQEELLETHADEMQQLKQTLHALSHEFRTLQWESARSTNSDTRTTRRSAPAIIDWKADTFTTTTTTTMAESSNITSLQDQLFKWQTLYFDTMDVGSTKLEALEQELDQLQWQRQEEAQAAVAQLEKIQAQFQSKLEAKQQLVDTLQQQQLASNKEAVTALQDQLERAQKTIADLKKQQHDAAPAETLASIGTATGGSSEQDLQEQIKELETKWNQEKTRSTVRERELHTLLDQKEQELATRSKSDELVVSRLQQQHQQEQASLKLKIQSLESQLAQTNLISQQAQGDLATQEQLVTTLQSQLQSLQEQQAAAMSTSSSESTKEELKTQIEELREQLDQSQKQCFQEQTARKTAESSLQELTQTMKARLQEAERDFMAQQESLIRQIQDEQSKNALQQQQQQYGVDNQDRLREQEAVVGEDRLERTNQALNEAQAIILDFEKTLSEKEHQWEKERAELMAASQKAETANLSLALEQSLKALEDANSEKEQWEREKAVLEATIAAKSSELESAKGSMEEMDELKRVIFEATTKFHNLESLFSDKERQWEDERKELQASAEWAAREVEEGGSIADEVLERTIQALNEAQAKISDLEKAFSEKEQQYKRERAGLMVATDKAASQEAETAKLSVALQQSQKALEDATRTIDELQASFDAQLKSWDNELLQGQKGTSVDLNSVGTTSEELSNTKKALEEAKAKEQLWEKERTELVAEAGKAALKETETTELSRALEQSEKALEDANGRIQELQSSYEGQRKLWEDERAELLEAQKATAEVLNSFGTLSHERDEAKKTLEETKEVVQRLEALASENQIKWDQERIEMQKSLEDAKLESKTMAGVASELEEAKKGLDEMTSRIRNLEKSFAGDRSAWEKERIELISANDKVMLELKSAESFTGELKEGRALQDDISAKFHALEKSMEEERAKWENERKEMHLTTGREQAVAAALATEETLTKDLDALRGALDEATTTVEGLEKSASENQSTHEKVRNELEALGASFAKSREDWEKERDDHNAALEAANAKLQALSSSHGMLKTFKKELEDNIQSFQDQLKEREQLAMPVALQSELEGEREKTKIAADLVSSLQEKLRSKDTLEKDLLEAREGLLASESELHQTKEALDQAELQIHKLTEVLKDVTSAHEQRLADLLQEMQKKDEAAKEIQSKCDSLSSAAAAAEASAIEFSTRVKELEVQLQAALAGAQSADALKEELENMSQESKNLKDKLSSAEAKLIEAAELTKKLDVQSDALETAKRNLEEAEAKVVELESKIAGLEAESPVKHEIEHLLSSLEKKESELQDLKTTVATLEVVQKSATENEAKLHEALGARARAESDCEKLRASEDILKAELDAQTKKCEVANSVLANLKKQRDEESQSKRNLLEKTQSERKLASVGIAKVISELEEVQATHKKATTQMGEEIVSLRTSLNESTAKVSTLESQIIELTRERDVTAKKSSDTESALEESQAALKAAQVELQEAIESKENGDKKASSEIAALNEELLSARQKADGLASELESSTQLVADLRRQVQDLEAAREASADALSKVAEKHKELLAPLQAAFTKVQSDCVELRNQLDEEEKSTDRQLQEAQQLFRLASKEREYLQQELSKLQGLHLDALTSLKEKDRKIAGLQTRLDELVDPAALTSREAQIAKLSELNAGQFQLFEERKQEIEKLLVETERARGEAALSKEIQSELEAKLVEKEEKILAAEQDIVESNRRMAEIQSQLEQLQSASKLNIEHQLEQQQKRINQLESQLQQADQKLQAQGNNAKKLAVAQAQLEEEQANSKVLLKELELSQQEADALRKERDELYESARSDGEAAEAEMERLGEVAVMELEKLGMTVKTLEAQKENQIKVITSLEKRLTDLTAKSLQTEARLRDQLAREKAKVDAMSFEGPPPTNTGSNHRSRRLSEFFTSRTQDSIPEIDEHSDKGGDDKSVSTLGSLTSGVSQSELLGVAQRKRRESITNPWNRFSTMILDIESTEEADTDTDLNGLFRQEKRAEQKRRSILLVPPDSNADGENLNKLFREEKRKSVLLDFSESDLSWT